MTHCCVIDLADVGDRVSGSSGKREKNRWKVRLECVQSAIGTFQYFDAVMLQECGMQSCGISILNETNQTKRNKQMKHKQF